MAQYIYTMNRVGKVVPPKRVILRDISLSFFPGAKIGVLGLNGSGKSTLLKIMGGIDTNFEGEARAQTGIKVGYLPQEPQLDPDKDVRSVVMEGLGGAFAQVARFNEISDKFAEPMDDDEMNKLLEEQAKLQDAIDAVGGWELERKLEIAADALRLPPWDAIINKLSGGEKRRVALCRLLLSAPDMLLLDEPTNHLDAESIAWLEKYLEAYPSTVIAVTHDRYFLDNVAEWILELDRGHGIPYQGNYSTWLEQKGARLAAEERTNEGLRKQLATELEWVRTSPKGRRAKNKARVARYEELASREFQERNETNEIYIPPGERLGDRRHRSEEPAQVVRRPPAHRQPELQPARRRHRRHHRPERRRQDHAVPHDVGAREARQRRAAHRPDGEARVRRPVAPVAQRQEDRLAGNLRRPRHDQGRQLRDAVARLRRTLQFQGHAASSRSSASCRAANATACTSPRCSSPAATC